ncbi:MAG: hypothetical protein K2W85_15235 [Phycisphaerales bacterium]|nr:hypothetical protein [Phycisphaerales bacterium]
MSHRAFRHTSSLAVPITLAALLAASGCASKGKPGDLPEPDGSKLLRPIPKQTPKSRNDELNQAALDLQSLFEQKPNSADDAPAPDAAPQPAPSGPSARRAPRSAAPQRPIEPATAPAATVATPTPAPVPAPADTRTLIQRQQDAAKALADLLRPEIGAAREPIKAAIPLLALNAIAPSAAKESLSAIEKSVTPDQRRSLDAIRAVLKAADEDPSVAAGEPEAVARVLKDFGERLQPAPPPESLTIARALLCTRVEAFGRYTPVATTAFLAGRTNAVILYTEPRNFAHAAATIPDSAGADHGWSVELAQSVTLHLDADGSEQFVVPEVIIKDASRSQRRDFYLVQRLDLPKALTVGEYNLKVRIRDIIGGGVAEHAIPVRIVADASALRSGR